MKIKYKQKNCPRLQRAIKQTISYVNKFCCWWLHNYCLMHPSDFGKMIFDICYKTDKYDVFNRLNAGFRQLLRSFIRADMRWEKPTKTHTIGVLIIIFIFIITF